MRDGDFSMNAEFDEMRRMDQEQASSSLQPDCCAAAWKRLALTLAEESQAVLDNAHWEVSFGSGDLRRTIKAVRELQRLESAKPHNADISQAGAGDSK
jgi:hypothetical protein